MTARTEGIHELALPDLERRQANAIRMGTVLAVDYAAARVRIKSGDIETAWLPWSTGRASGAKRRWDPPEVDEQVVVLSPTGDMRQGVVLTGVFQDAAGAPSASGDKDTTVYGDGTVIEYDRASHTLLADLGASKFTMTRDQIVLEIGGTKLTMTTAGSVFDGPVTVNGLLTYTQGLMGSGGSGASVQGPLSINGGTVTHNGTNIGNTHTHTGVQTGGGTTGAPS